MGNFSGVLKRFNSFLFMFWVLIIFSSSAFAAAELSVAKRLGWSIVGLDSNKPLVDGPDTFALGYRYCNTGDTAAIDVNATLHWDSDNIYVDLQNGSQASIIAEQIDPATCYDFYYNITIVRDSNAYDTARQFHIGATHSTNATPVTTTLGEEVFVEHLVSQNRNSINSVTGPDTVVKGRTYTFVLDGSTAPGGYEQLDTFLDFPNNIFRIVSVSSTYTQPDGAINDAIYADACGWENDPLSGDYRSCVGPEQYLGGKVGADIIITYEVEIIGTGTADVSALIYDFSGSSFHYNSDYGSVVKSITAIDPSDLGVEITKTADHTTLPVASGQEATFTLFTKTYSTALSDVNVIDTLPTGWSYRANSAVIVQADGSTVTTPGSDPSIDGQVLKWQLGAMDADNNITITYTAVTTQDFNAGDTTTNYAETNVTEADGTPYSFSDSHTIKFVSIEANKKSTPEHSPLLAGDNIVYTIEVNNTAPLGTSATINNVSITDVLPAGVTYVSNTAFVTQPVDDGNNTFYDQFNTNNSYAGDDGDTSWSTNWIETDEDGTDNSDGGAGSGDVYVASNELVFTSIDNNGDGVYREVDLSAYTSGITLSFEYRHNAMDVADSVNLEVSQDGGVTWVLLDTYIGDGGTDSSNIQAEYNIQSYFASNTQIRFMAYGIGNNEYFYVDNVQITAFKRKMEILPVADISNINLIGKLLAGENLWVDFDVVVDDPLAIDIADINNTAFITSTEIVNPIVVRTNDPVLSNISPTANDDTQANTGAPSPTNPTTLTAVGGNDTDPDGTIDGRCIR
jgi:uncharacterized repeat protein (TIGR01451 family)/fimbrial isopeptide formation D2 family protein